MTNRIALLGFALVVAGCSSGGASSSSTSAGASTSATAASSGGSGGATHGTASSSAAASTTGTAGSTGSSASTGTAGSSGGSATNTSTTSATSSSASSGASTGSTSASTSTGSSTGTSGCSTSQIVGTWDPAAHPPGRACTDGGWCLYEQTAAFSPSSLVVFGPADAWASDLDSVMWKYDGAIWSPVSRANDSTGPVAPLGGTSDTDLWAAGSQVGLVHHFDGLVWTEYQLPTFSGVNGWYAAAPNDVYAVTGAGLVHFDGCQWSLVTLPTNSPYFLSGISGVDAGDIWLLATYPGTNDQVLHWDGSVWSELDTGNQILARGIWASGQTDVWLAGTDESGATAGAIEHFDGANWTLATVPSALAWSNFQQTMLYALWGTGPRDVWAFGDATSGNPGVILHFDGAAWTQRTDAPTVDPAHPAYVSDDFVAAAGSSATDIWAVGNFGAISHFDGGAWSSHRNSPFVHLAGVYSGGPDEAFAVGSNGGSGTAEIEQWDGRAWHTQRQLVDADGGGVYFLTGVSGWAENDVWAVGEETRNDVNFPGNAFATHWDGASWTDTTNFQLLIPNAFSGFHSPALYAVSAFSATDAWAVGEDGATLQNNGAGWSALPNPIWSSASAPFWGLSGKALRGVMDLGPYAWAVGDEQHFPDGGMGPTMLVWAGSNWALDSTLPIDPVLQQFGTVPILFSVWASSNTDVWAVGASIYHRDASGWSLVPITGMTSCYLPLSVGGDAAGNVYVGCQGPVIERWNGAGWDEEFLPYEQSQPLIYGIDFNPDGGFWAVGQNGYVYRHP